MSAPRSARRRQGLGVVRADEKYARAKRASTLGGALPVRSGNRHFAGSEIDHKKTDDDRSDWQRPRPHHLVG